MNMEEKSTKRYLSFCKSLDNLKLSCGANPNENFVLSGTAQTVNRNFDLAWKVMKDIIVSEYGIVDFATGSPRDTLKTAYSVGLISDDLWLQMLKVRNTLIHDYDGDVAKRYFKNITEDFFELLQQLRSKAEQWYQVDESDGR